MHKQSSVVSALADAGSLFVHPLLKYENEKEKIEKAIMINFAHMNLSSHVVT
jgi:hypothetical protein